MAGGEDRRRVLTGRRMGAVVGVVIGVGVLVGAGALVLDGEEPAATDTQSPSRPNVVVVMTDDQNRSEMRALPRTRRLIGDAGVRFANFYVTDPLCCPSRATFLSGQYAHNHGVESNGGPAGLPALAERRTLAPWLESAGYETVQVGKYLNGYGLEHPTRVPPGWSDWHALVDPSTEAYYDYTVNDNGTLESYGSSRRDYKTRVIGRTAAASIRRAAGDERPLFMFVGFNAPHAPSVPARRDADAFAALRPPRTPAFDERDVGDKPSFMRRRPRLDAAALDRIADRRRRALQTLLAVDREIARIVAELRRQGELDTTFIAFTSDNGYLAGEHRIEFGKLLAYEPSSHVPLLVRGPGIPAGKTSRELVANIDLAPTILELAGATPTLPPDGRSLLPAATEPSLRTRRPLLIESLIRDRSTFYGHPYRAVRAGRYLFVEYETGDAELYDLRRDPQQLASAAEDPRYAETRTALAAGLAELADCAGESCRVELAPLPGPR